MNTFSFLIAFSALLCGALASQPILTGHYYGHGHGHDGHDGHWHSGHGANWNSGHASVRAWEEPAAPSCDGGSSGARVHVSTSSDYSALNTGCGGAGYAGAADIAPIAAGPIATPLAAPLSGPIASAPCAPCRTTYQQHPGFPQQNERGEIIIHRPAPIIVKRPPTKVLVNHPPLVVKPAPVVLHRPAPLVVKPVLVRHHPQPVKVEPVYVKVMKPATSERYLLDDRHNAGCGGDDATYAGNYAHAAASVSAVDTGCH